jgi:3-hydroxybutyryl-CoA dehydratase
MDINNIKINDKGLIKKKFTEKDLLSFSELSEDRNPVHLNEEYAKTSRYKRRINYGLLCASLFSGIFSSQIPGEGCVYKYQELKFLRPIPIDIEITAEATVNIVDKKRKLVFFKTRILNNNKVLISGNAEIFIP